MPATKTARKPEPREHRRCSVDDAGGRERPQRVEADVREREAAHDVEERVRDPRRRRRARPSSRARTRATIVHIVPSSEVANSIIPIISAMPTGSLAPDSASRIVPVRPETSRLPSTENITAGSVGAIAAPTSPEVIHENPSSQCAARATIPAVANVPGRPSSSTGTHAVRRRRRPIREPPSKRITTSATTPIRSTVRIWSLPSDGKMSDSTAAASRKSAGPGRLTRSLTRLDSTASAKPAATRSTTSPKVCTSCIRGMLRNRPRQACGRRCRERLQFVNLPLNYGIRGRVILIPR